jgi:serine/threonine protein kinase
MGNCWASKNNQLSIDVAVPPGGNTNRKTGRIGDGSNDSSGGSSINKNKRSIMSSQEGSKITRIDSLDMVPGEEELYSKTVNLNHFEIIKVIGRGSFGKVYMVKKKDTDEFYAMKVLKKEAISSPSQRIHIIAERRILQEINNTFVVKLHYAFQTPDKLYFVMDFLNGGEMFTHLRKKVKFPEKRARFYCAEIILALK